MFTDPLLPADHIIEIEFDRRRNARLRNPDVVCEYINSLLRDKQQYYLFLDEVQLLEDFEAVLNDYLHVEHLDIYVTGSNSRFLSSDILTEFRGRGDEVHIFPLSYKEFHQSFTGTREDAWQAYLMFGGLPLILSKETDEEKTEYLKSLFHTVYLADVIKRNHIKKHPEELEDLLQILASSVGSLTNPGFMLQSRGNKSQAFFLTFRQQEKSPASPAFAS